MVLILEDYKTLKGMLSDLIVKSGYRNDFIAKKIGMSPSYFSTKKVRGNWSDEEVKKNIESDRKRRSRKLFDAGNYEKQKR